MDTSTLPLTLPSRDTVMRCFKVPHLIVPAALLLLLPVYMYLRADNRSAASATAIVLRNDLLPAAKLELLQDSKLEGSHSQPDECVGNTTEWKERMNMMYSVYDSQDSNKYKQLFRSICHNRMFYKFCHRKQQDDVSLIERKCTPAEDMRFMTQPEAKKRGLFMLASYPGSGNTWSRLILEELTGIYTGSIYCDHLIALSGHFGEGFAIRETIAVKAHGSMGDVHEHPVSVIYLVRNPYHAILSGLSFSMTKAHTLSVQIDSLTDAKVDMAVTKWLGNIRKWIVEPTWKVTVISFDALVSNFASELQKFVSAVDFPVKQESIDCLIGNRMDAHVRNKEKGENPLTEEQQQVVQQAILSMASIWEQHNIDYRSWTW